MTQNKTKQPTEGKGIKDIISYLIKPPMVADGSRYDFEEGHLKKMVEKLSKKDKYKLLGNVDVVCIQWNSLRLAPNNDIGIIARYQTCKQILESLPIK
jgi:hypothetical protein